MFSITLRQCIVYSEGAFISTFDALLRLSDGALSSLCVQHEFMHIRPCSLTLLTVALLFITSVDCVRHLLQPSSTPTGHQLNYLLMVMCYISVKVPLKGSCYAHVRTCYDSPYHEVRLSPW